ncbi:MAG: winged helix-turn-helix transcriptional regulator [Proteobacteria bacterium]|nr:winged helix-turn-helix transcriptional regulator [Pseudomonadota bacterium]
MAGLLADPVRAALIMALMDGRAWTAGELAASAGASPQLASHHLGRLVEGGVVSVSPQGRHRYHRIATPEVARAIEALAAAGAALPSVRPRPVRAPQGLRLARSCYDHMAGALGVAVAERARERGLIGGDGEPSEQGRALLASLGQDGGACGRCRPCLDWTERRDHLAGGFAKALLTGLLDKGLVARNRIPRALTVTGAGRRWFVETLDLDVGAVEREANGAIAGTERALSA